MTPTHEPFDVHFEMALILPNADETKSRCQMTPNDIVFIKLVPSGKLYSRVMEAAYAIYNPKTRQRNVRQFIMYHPASHAVYKDTFADYHMAPTEGDGRSLLQLCKDKNVAKAKIQDFCQSLTDDLHETFGSNTRHITFVGDHIWQTRSLLFPFLFCQNPWIKLPNRRQLIHFVEYRTFMQPFAVMHTQMDEPFELPQWVFRAFADVNAQVNYFDTMIQSVLRRTPILQVQLVDDDDLEQSDEQPACCSNQSCDNYAPKYCGNECSCVEDE